MRLDDPYLMLAIAGALGVVATVCSLVQLSIRVARRYQGRHDVVVPNRAYFLQEDGVYEWGPEGLTNLCGRKVEVDSLVQQADEMRSDILGTKWPWGHDNEDQETQ